jgi:hypothetical protein
MDAMRVSCESIYGDYLEGTVPADTDLDGVFVLTTDDGRRMRVNGWQGYIDILFYLMGP